MDYNAKVVRANANLRELTDTKVLQVINELRKAKDYISQICLVGLCVGSRISEICLVSTYEDTDNPRYIKVIGFAKDRRARAGAGDDEKIGDNSVREITKPIILLLSDELIDVVVSLRTQLENRYDIDLGVQNPDGKQTDTKQITAWVDAKANQKLENSLVQNM